MTKGETNLALNYYLDYYIVHDVPNDVNIFTPTSTIKIIIITCA